MNNAEGISVLPNNLTVVCRLCLTVNEKLFQLFRSDEIETSAVPLSMKVMLCTAIRMSKQDILPHKICQSCINYVNEWYTFRKKCMTNDVYLKKCLSTGSTQETQQSQDQEKVKFSNLDFEENELENGGKLNLLIKSETFSTEVDNGIGGFSKNVDEMVGPSFDDSIFCESEVKKVDVLNDGGKPLLKSPTKKFKCVSCPDSFYYAKDLKVHKSVIHKTVKSEKMTAKEAVPVKEVDVKLDDVNVRTRYEMKCCEKVFYSKIKFRKHYNKEHPGEKPFMCETCGKKDFISEETLKRHKILHTGKYRCDICSKTFTCNAILIIHKRDKHENDKPFICDVCGKRFVTELLMNYHKRFHTGEKKYVCEECGLAVVTSSSLAKHKRIHSNVKPHVCQVCGKGFIIKGRLVEHLRIHTGERPYSCHICQKGFTMRDKLKRHIRIHSGEKLFSCEYCGNNYSTSYGLTVHLKSHIVRNY